MGLKSVRCRRIVRPGERLFVMVKLLKIRGTLLTCQFQCAVRKRLVCDGVLIGGVFPWMKDQHRDCNLSKGYQISRGRDARGCCRSQFPPAANGKRSWISLDSLP